MRRRLHLLLSLFLLLPLLGCTGHPAAESPVRNLSFPPLEFHVPQVERLTLPNGIRLYLKEDHELPLVAVTAMMGAGSISVPAEKTGMGALLAALLRTGGAGELSPAQVDEALARLAANLAVSTDTYTTNFNLSLQTKDLDRGMAVLADMMRRPRFAPDRLELARQQAIEAVRRENDEPGSIASRALMKAIYGDHPLGRSPTVASLQAVQRDDLQDFHQRYFHPNNLWLAISGDFRREELLQLLTRVFGDWPQGQFTAQKIPPVTAEPRPVVLVADKSIPQTTILMGELGIDKSSPDLFPVRVMNYILGGGGFNSRLMSEVRSNRGLAYSVYSYYQVGRRLPGPFIAGTETKTSTTLEAVRLMREIMEKMRQAPVSEKELKLAKESLINSFVFAFNNTHSVVTQQMILDYYDYPPDYLQTYRDRVAAVTAEDVLKAAQKHLHPERESVVLVGDREDFAASPASLGMPVEPVKLNGNQ